MKRISLLLPIWFALLSLTAQIPSGYYLTAEGKKQSELRLTLKTIISSGHNVPSYNGLWSAYKTTDINPSTGKIWDMYSNCPFTWSVDQNSGNSGAECLNYNREHTTPQSWFGEAAPMVSDLYNVYPTDTKVNGIRSNYPYGEVGTASTTSGNGSKLGLSSFSGYTGTVFEPINEYKGDLARTCLYMATRYAGLCENWGGEGAKVYSATYLGLTAYAKDLFLKWSRQDPVSAKEISRNNAVYGVQHNRNPYIDYPQLAEYIWGNKQSELFSSTTGVEDISFAPKVFYKENELIINDLPSDAILTVYDLQGRLLKKTDVYIGENKISIQQKNPFITVITCGKGIYTKKMKAIN